MTKPIVRCTHYLVIDSEGIGKCLLCGETTTHPKTFDEAFSLTQKLAAKKKANEKTKRYQRRKAGVKS